MLKRIIGLAIVFILIVSILSMGSFAQEQSKDFEIVSIGHSMSSYQMFVLQRGVTGYSIPLFATKEDKDITELLENELVGRKVSLIVEDYDNSNVYDDAIISWKLLPVESSVTVSKKYTLDYAVWNTLQYGDSEFLKIINQYFEEEETENKPKLYPIGQIEFSKIKIMFKQKLDFAANLVYNKDYSFDIFPTKENGYEWTYTQCTEIRHLLMSRNLNDKFGFILDYRSDDVLCYGIRGIQKSKDAPFVNEPNIKARYEDIRH